MPDDLYERDFYAWPMREAGLLQRLAQGERVNDALDAANLAEEIESLGRSQKREISSRLRVLLTHMLKWQYQPDARSGSWKATIREQRRELEAVLEDSPSLRSIVPERIAPAYQRALRRRRRRDPAAALSIPGGLPLHGGAGSRPRLYAGRRRAELVPQRSVAPVAFVTAATTFAEAASIS